MKSLYAIPFITIAALAPLTEAGAAKKAPEPVISQIDMARSVDNTLFITYVIEKIDGKIGSNKELEITPVLTYAGEENLLPSSIYAGHNAYIVRRRQGNLPQGELLKANAKNTSFTYALPFIPGMEQVQLSFRSTPRGCACKATGNSETLPETLAMDFAPQEFQMSIPTNQLAALEKKPEQVVKSRSLSRSAFISYPVNVSVLKPDYRNNPVELHNIMATIDSVRNDKDLTVNNVNIHGYASPEGPYSLNEKLAKGRTESLRAYVDKQYGFGNKLTAESTGEDWEGLRIWVQDSELPHRDEILGIIKSRLGFDEKEAKIKKLYPEDWKVMMAGAFPTLRRADYKIDYTVRTYTEASTISNVMEADPSKLSLEEIMILARTYPEDSDKRAELIYKAAAMFPDDERAQLNAAFQALERRELENAARYLAKSGDSDLATYGRGLFQLYSGNESAAAPLLQKAAAAGIDGAAAAADFLKK